MNSSNKQQSLAQMSEEEERILAQRELESQLAFQNQQSGIPYSAAMFGSQSKQNLVEWQLDFRPELEDIQRLLRCDVIEKGKDGEEYWVKNSNPAFVVFNDIGVNDIIREIRLFLNKNKVLSNYSFEEIKPRVRMLGHELRALIYNNFEQYGMDNEYKMNNYSIMVLSLLDMIDSAYRRAYNGEERRDLNSARTVHQTEPMMPMNMPMYSGHSMNQNPARRGTLSRAMPWNWGR